MSSTTQRRLRALGETCLWLLVIGVTVAAVLWLAARLRLAVLPVLLALVLATFFAPPVGWAKRHGMPAGLAAAAALLVAVLALSGIGLVVWQGVADFDQLDVSLSSGVEDVENWLADGPLAMSESEIGAAADQVQEAIRNHVGGITRTALTGAMTALEVLAGLLLAGVLLFFFLKDGERIWSWLRSLAPPHRRDAVQQLGEGAWGALGGFLRGQTVVALFDATFIGLAILLLGVPLVLPLALLTFVGAYVPVLGATLAGGAAALVALVAEGPVTALLVVAAVLAVQQIEGNLFQPVVVGRAVDVHPVALLLGVTIGAVTAGILGAMVAAPVVAVGGAMLGVLRERAAGAEDDCGTLEP